MALVFLVRLVECYESMLVLAANGIRVELTSLFRVFLDAYFVLANVCSRPSHIAEYLATDHADRLKLLNVIEKQDNELFRLARESIPSEERHTLQAFVKEERLQPFQSYANAAAVGCEAIYDSMYRLSSPAVHTGPRVWEGYAKVDDTGVLAVMHTTYD